MDGVADVREDEEQGVKLQETMELLVAAGYFRARIKGLHPFDKVVGGMVWCLEVCNLDVDVDLLFQESLTIGQKIALTEKIVAVLPQMQCPYRLDPHQIQGLDFVHIYPVVQWLVKKAIETREETGDTNRAYALRQFDKSFNLPEDVRQQESLKKSEETLMRLNNSYAPRRKYRRKAGSVVPDFSTQIRYTLLEYGSKAGDMFGRKQAIEDPKNKSRKKGAEEHQDQETEQLKNMVDEMEQLEERGRRVKASTIGNIVSQQADQITELEALHERQKAELESMAAEGLLVGPNKQKHLSELLRRQADDLKANEQQVAAKKASLETRLEELKTQKRELKAKKIFLDEENVELDRTTSNLDEEQLEQVADLLKEKSEMEQKIVLFRGDCKAEASTLKAECLSLQKELQNPSTDNHQQIVELKERLEVEKDSLKQVRLRLGQRNREIAQVQRRLDDVPSQAELSQYQKRFIELYDQVAAKLRETKKYYTLYNSLTDTKMYYEKEVQLLESIHDTFEIAMGSESAKEQFLRQLEQILSSLRQTVTKANKRRQNEKLKRDQLNDTYLELLEKQRMYHKFVKEFQQECAKNEELHAVATERGLE